MSTEAREAPSSRRIAVRMVSALAVAVLVLFVVVARPSHTNCWLAAILGGSAGICAWAARERKLASRVEEAEQQAELLRTEVEAAGEQERQRIAADFHDGPLQSFISLQMRLQIVKKMFQKDAAAGLRELEQLQELCQSQVAELRSFIRGMRPPESGAGGLAMSIARIVELFQKDTGIVATFHRSPGAMPEVLDSSTEILQLVREALTNVQKHSKASRVAVSVARAEAALEISIEDDGTGFPFAGSYSLEELEVLHLGPVSVRRRVRDLCGELTVESRPGHGASVLVRIPL